MFIYLCIFIKYYYIYLFVNGGSLQAADGVKVYFYSGHVNLATFHFFHPESVCMNTFPFTPNYFQRCLFYSFSDPFFSLNRRRRL